MNVSAAANFPQITARSLTGEVSRYSSRPERDSSLTMRIVRSGGKSTHKAPKTDDSPSARREAEQISPPPLRREEREKEPLGGAPLHSSVHAPGPRKTP